MSLANDVGISLFFYRDSKGNEVDILYTVADKIIPIEIKSGETINHIFFKGLDYFDLHMLDKTLKKILVYGGDKNETRRGVTICALSGLIDALSGF